MVLKVDGPPYVCKTDEVGEICACASAAGASYWGLGGLTNATFRCSLKKKIGQSGLGNFLQINRKFFFLKKKEHHS